MIRRIIFRGPPKKGFFDTRAEWTETNLNDFLREHDVQSEQIISINNESYHRQYTHIEVWYRCET